MLVAMDASLQLMPGVALKAVATVLHRHGVRAEAMHPGVRDADMARWYTLRADSAEALATAVQALLAAPGVAAAYLKPEGEPPA